MEPSHKGRCFLKDTQLWAPAFCWTSHSSDDKCDKSHTVIPSLAAGFPFQSQAKPEVRTGLTHSWLLLFWLENTKLHFSCCVSEKTGAVDQEHCASLPVFWLTAACL